MKPAKVEWSKLEDATGDASRVGDWIETLASPRAPSRVEAIGRLWAHLCNQGTVSEASLAAVPYLFAQLLRRGMRDRDEIICLLVGIAVGDHSHFLDGSAAPHKRAPKRAKKAKSIEGRCYDAVLANLKVFRDLVGDGDAKVRAAAAFALAWFPDDKGVGAARLMARSTVERDEAAEASMAITLGHLGVEEAWPILRELFRAKSKLLRVAAAIALAYLDPKEKIDDIRGVLGEGLGDLDRTRVPWNGGNLGEHAAAVLLSLRRPAA